MSSNSSMLTTPKKPDYGFAYFIVYLMYFLAVVVFLIGLALVGPALQGNTNIFQYGYGVYGVGLMIASIAMVAAAQITKAIIDTALFSWHTMMLTKNNNGAANDRN